MQATIPDFCLVLIAGAPAAADTAAHRWLMDDEVVRIRPGSAREIAAGKPLEAALAHAARRLHERKFVAVVASGLGSHARASFAATAKAYLAQAVAIVLEDDVAASATLAAQLAHEGYADVRALPAEAATQALQRQPLAVDLRDETGPLDIIGDVHGCADELEELLGALGYEIILEGDGEARRAITRAPAGRRAVFVGDLVDRGPRSADSLRIAMAMVAAGQALAVPGNHDVKFLRWLKGAKVRIAHGLQTTIDDVAPQPASFREAAQAFLEQLPIHLWLDGGRLVVAHAGIRADMIGRMAPRVREFCLYGDTAGETDAQGLPVRYHWAAEYSGDAAVVYGHTPIAETGWLNGTLCIDTGCCFGGRLTALRWPERETVSVAARRAYADRLRPFGHPPLRPLAARRAV